MSDHILYRYTLKDSTVDGIKIFQYEKACEHGLASKVIADQVRANGDILDANSNEYYMDANSASRINTRNIERARNPDALERLYANEVPTPCKLSECYGLCGRRACLNASYWKDI